MNKQSMASMKKISENATIQFATFYKKDAFSTLN